MKKIALMILSGLLVGLIIADAHAQQAPIEQCSIKRGEETWVTCNVVENGLRVRNIVLNRGNCKSPMQAQNELIDDMEKVVRGRRPSNPIETNAAFGMCVFQLFNDNKRLCYEETKKNSFAERIFQFGDEISFNIGIFGLQTCNLLELNFVTNKGDATHRWR